MKKSFILFILISASIQISCSSSKSTSSYPNEDQINSMDGVENPDAMVSLADHLRRVPGVRVEGKGYDTTVTIQGIKTFNSGTNPLFIVDGQQINGSFSELEQMVNPNDIKSIRVLKEPGELAYYGVQGTNGVIVIKLKNQ
jgi:TonB-dependent SusC/RagA subfamily outer membrane receptor